MQTAPRMPHAVSQNIVQRNMKRWMDALLIGKPEAVAAIYTEDATFLPTLFPDFKQGIPGAREYFVHFLEEHPIGTIIESAVQSLGEDAYLHSGLYDFEIDDGEGGRTTAHARFTYLWVQEDGGWKIAHHHSSLVPNL